ncbi:hypothetical protein SAMN04488090_4825 [Siphonobacter aquaeclarae]|uniref:Uncharacterized protein n=1 Tax=Siphonobacter aquaeclarae TaxID=563176 RepID=A0A1G9Y5H4_9BACT|nr:hypothetical protein SAMN04488090_4825 [Siphonobacter aquaeclarae]
MSGWIFGMGRRFGEYSAMQNPLRKPALVYAIIVLIAAVAMLLVWLYY